MVRTVTLSGLLGRYEKWTLKASPTTKKGPPVVLMTSTPRTLPYHVPVLGSKRTPIAPSEDVPSQAYESGCVLELATVGVSTTVRSRSPLAFTTLDRSVPASAPIPGEDACRTGVGVNPYSEAAYCAIPVKSVRLGSLFSHVQISAILPVKQ